MSLSNRLQKNSKHLAKWARKNNIEAYRLYDRDIPEYPFMLDVYGSNIVIHFRWKQFDFDKGIEQREEELFQAIIELGYNENQVFIKNRQSEEQYKKIDAQSFKLDIQEGPLKFEVNLSDYVDTGLFLDHRPLRQLLIDQSKDKNILNLFCYTGSLSVSAAYGGAKKVTSVDLSNTYLEWAQRNFLSNNLDISKNQFVKAEILTELPKLFTEKSFDIIILDPPTFSNSKSMDSTFDVQKDHSYLIHQCMKLLANDGYLYFSNNKRDFKIDSIITEKYRVNDLTFSSIPQDFKDKKIHQLFKIEHR